MSTHFSPTPLQPAALLFTETGRVDLVQTKAILANPKLVELSENAVMDVYEAEPGKMMMKAEAVMKDGARFLPLS